MTRRSLPASLLGVALSTACITPDEGDSGCAIHAETDRCQFVPSYDPEAFGEGWLVLRSDTVASCIETCDTLGTLRTMQTGVIVDESAYRISDAEIADTIDQASIQLFNLTGTTMALHGIQRLATSPADSQAVIGTYTALHAANPPHVVMVITDDPVAVSFGGYAIASLPLPGYCNDFTSVSGNNRVLGAVIDWTHRFGTCGYDLDEYEASLAWNQVSTTSLADGSCQNTAGVPCVHNPAVGYQVCGTWDPSLPYLQHPQAFVQATYIHEIMHHFGFNGNLDHFGTTVCDGLMGGPYGVGNIGTFQEFAGMCPAVYDQFVSAYAPCP